MSASPAERPATLEGASESTANLVYDERGLVTVVAQDIASGAVLMVAWANQEAVRLTRETGLAHFWSRSRSELWKKGETSGNQLIVSEVLADCDQDTLIYRVHATGPACHRGTRTCFDGNSPRLELGWLAAVIASRTTTSGTGASSANASEATESGGGARSSYTRKLLDQGLERVAQKVGEEAVELVISALARAADSDKPETVSEAADLLYHLLVLLQALEIDAREVAEELTARHRSALARAEEAVSGAEEVASGAEEVVS